MRRLPASLLLLRLKAQGVRLGFSTSLWTLAVIGGLLVLGSFMMDFHAVLRQMMPSPFHWGVFALGLGLAIAALVIGILRLRQPSRPV